MKLVKLALRKKVMKREPPKVDEILFMQPEEVLKMVGSSSTPLQHKSFTDLLDKNHFTNIHLLTGYEQFEQDSEFFILRSGRMINSTRSWNPFVFALVFDHDEVLKYLQKKANSLNIKKCLYVENFFEFDDH